MPTQKFFDAWDDIIAKWMNISCVSDPSNPFKPLQVHPNLDPTNVIDITIKTQMQNLALPSANLSTMLLKA